MLLTDVSGCSPVVKEGQVQQVGTVRVSDKAVCSLHLIAMHVCHFDPIGSDDAAEKSRA